ncbi:MAG: ferric reductase-like transmembrane domain-containing protein [Candidatus Pacearchaeota archaeon]
MEKRPYVVSLIVVLVFCWNYFIYLSRPFELNYINAVVAFSGAILLGFSMAMGSLAKFIRPFRRILNDRRKYGMIGYSLISLHVFLVMLIIFQNESPATMSFVVSIAFAVFSFAIFSIMAFTSSNKWIKSLGIEKWKKIQNLGYLALVFVIAHIALLANGAFVTQRLTGQIVLSFLMLVLLLKIFSYFLRRS